MTSSSNTIVLCCLWILIIVLVARSDKYSHHWVVELGSNAEATKTAEQIARQLGLRYLGKHGALAEMHEFEGDAPRQTRRRRNADKTRDGPNWLSTIDETFHELVPNAFFERQIPKKRVKRAVATEFQLNDPFYPKAWYMNGDVADDHDMHIKTAWQEGYSGIGVVVTILDDGVERNHPDLKANYDQLASYDFNSKDNDPTPRYDFKSTNQHGTRCAGQVAAAANNSICSVGVAFNAHIGGVRMLDGRVTDSLEARSLSLRLDHIDIFSASWGPPDDGQTVDGPGHLAKRALLKGVLEGRNGRGAIYVWSSGNGGIFEDSCACDGYANSIFTLSISSASERGMKPWYLEECSSTLAATYSSGEPMFERQVVTTDVRGGCTNNHTGTSASAPIAAGIVALALEANPLLTWRDVQHIIVETSRSEPLELDGQFIVNGVGKKVSSRFGFGLMDAIAMVRLAETWKTVPEQHICMASVDDKIPHHIPGDRLKLTVVVDSCTGTSDYVHYLEHVEARISLWYSIRGDLEIYLTSPAGTKSQLLPARGLDYHKGEFKDWPFVSVQFWGETAPGNWTLELVNYGLEDNHGVLRRWKLVLHGTEELPAASTLHRRATTGVRLLPAEATDSPFNTIWPLIIPHSEESAVMTPRTFNSCNISNCVECNLVSSTKMCSKCSQGYFLTATLTECLQQCPPGFCPTPQLVCGICFSQTDITFPSSKKNLSSYIIGDGILSRLPFVIASAVAGQSSPMSNPVTVTIATFFMNSFWLFI